MLSVVDWSFVSLLFIARLLLSLFFCSFFLVLLFLCCYCRLLGVVLRFWSSFFLVGLSSRREISLKGALFGVIRLNYQTYFYLISYIQHIQKGCYGFSECLKKEVSIASDTRHYLYKYVYYMTYDRPFSITPRTV